MDTSDDNLSRLKQAILVVAQRQLKENHDDTLTEKLISHVSQLVRRGGDALTAEDEEQLLHYMLSLSSQREDDPVVLRLLAVILSSERTFGSPTETSELALEKFATIASSIDASSDLSLQAALIQSLSLFTEKEWLMSGQLYSLPPISFPRIAYNLMIHSPSYFVRNDAEKLLIKLLDSSRFCSDTDLSVRGDHLNEILRLISATPDVKHLQFLIQVLEKTSCRRVIAKQNIPEAILKHFEDVTVSEVGEEKVFHLLCHVLGMLVLRPDSVEKVFSVCLKRNDLKALVIFTSRMLHVDREYLNKWLLYSLYTLVARTERRGEIAEQMLASLREKAFVERLADNSTILTVLNLMPAVFRNVDEKGTLVVEGLHIFLQTNLTDTRRLFDNRKVISEAILCLAKCSQEDLIVESEFNDILCDLILVSESSDSHTIEILKMARNFWQSKLLFSLFGSTAIPPIIQALTRLLSRDRFHKPIDSWTDCETFSEKDMEIMELAFEALTQLTGSPAIAEDQVFLQTLLSLWKLHSKNVTFLTSVIPILLAMDSMASEEVLAKFGWTKHADIPEQMCSALLLGFSGLSLKIVTTLKDNTERLCYLRIKKPEVFDDIISALCSACLNAVESEIHSEVLTLFLDILNPGSAEDLKHLYSNGMMTTAMIMSQNEMFPSNDVRVSAFEVSELIRLCIRCEALDSKSLMQLLLQAKTPRIFRSEERIENAENVAIVRQEDKVQVIDKLFREFNSQCTQDLIIELNDRDNNVLSRTSDQHLVSGPDLERVVEFYTSDSHYCQMENLTACIIDDILAAKEHANAASIDCY